MEGLYVPRFRPLQIHEPACSAPCHEVELLVVERGLQGFVFGVAGFVDLDELETVHTGGEEAGEADEADR